jgi:hypothetical protein
MLFLSPTSTIKEEAPSFSEMPVIFTIFKTCYNEKNILNIIKSYSSLTSLKKQKKISVSKKPNKKYDINILTVTVS